MVPRADTKSTTSTVEIPGLLLYCVHVFIQFVLVCACSCSSLWGHKGFIQPLQICSSALQEECGEYVILLKRMCKFGGASF